MRLSKLLYIGLFATSVALVSTGCAYRTDLVQGNFVELESVAQLRVGMTQEQVQYVLGTPMLVDPFDNSRWYYVHFLRQGWNRPNVKNLILKFENGKLVDVAGDYKKPINFNDGNFSVQKIDLSKIEAN